MRKIYVFVRKNLSVFLHIVITGAICIFWNYLIENKERYTFTINLLLAVVLAFCIYRIIFKRIYKTSALKIVCIVVLYFYCNKLYLYSVLIQKFPLLAVFDEDILVFIIALAVSIVLLTVEFVIWQDNQDKEAKKKDLSKVKEEDDESRKAESRKVRNSAYNRNVRTGESTLKGLHLVLGALLVITLVIGPLILLYVFNKYNWNQKALEFDELVSFLMSYGVAFLLILFALAVVVIALIHIVKYVFILISSFSKADNIKDGSENEESVPVYAISVMIVTLLLIATSRITSFRIDDLTERFVAGEYLAFPLAAIGLIVLFILLVQIVHAAFLLLNRRTAKTIKDFVSKQNKNMKLGEKITAIIEGVVGIILNTALSCLDFIGFIPDFFKSLSKMVLSNDKEKNLNTEAEGIRIVKIAAFCFALISWIATAQGLHTYVFQEYYWQALLVSFGIQSILFVFNLKLPYYFKKISERTNAASDKYRTGKFKYGKLWQVLIAVFYAIVLFSSSFFSFVYMANLVYKDTQYTDANIVLDKTYRMYVDDVDKYSNEMIKATQVIISRQLSELQTMTADQDDGTRRTKEEIEAQLLTAKSDYEEKLTLEKSKEEEYNIARDKYLTPMSEDWRSPEEYAAEQALYDQLRGELETAKNNTIAAKKKMDELQSELDNYKPSLEITVHDLLLESLKPQPDSEVLEASMTNLNDIILEEENSIQTERFVELVDKSQELSLAVDNYRILQQIQSQAGTNNDITDFKNAMLTQKIAVPDISSDTFAEDKDIWVEVWKERFAALEKVIKSVPEYSDSTITSIVGAESVIASDILLDFDAQDIANKIDRISRSNLENINTIERAFVLLTGEFPAMAIFSLIFALFLDMSSLLAGLFIYLTSGEYEVSKEHMPSERTEIEQQL